MKSSKDSQRSISSAEDQIELPKYECYKKVWALKIKIINRHNGYDPGSETDGSSMITPVEDGYAPFRVDAAYMHKHEPVVGGYYVVYKDGYKSFSPAKAFEEGYVRFKSKPKRIKED